MECRYPEAELNCIHSDFSSDLHIDLICYFVFDSYPQFSEYQISDFTYYKPLTIFRRSSELPCEFYQIVVVLDAAQIAD